ncbi:zinc ribbon domain-containing protein [Brachyspira aalborgi]|uniref:zinc ribbon domain-containing protein n=1 Tax=Brachyspira aalborgi TaxID=29522 RepID=UPI0018F6F5C1|nr:zinc ribbon domain-containing protein [Brachyspira aalborgi]
MNEVNNTQTYQKQLDEIFCSSCGKPIKKEAEICPYCGVRQKAGKKKKSKKKIFIIIGALIFIFISVGKIANNSDNTSSEEKRIEQENLKNQADELLSKLNVRKDDFQSVSWINQKRYSISKNGGESFELGIAMNSNYTIKAVHIQIARTYPTLTSISTLPYTNKIILATDTNNYSLRLGMSDYQYDIQTYSWDEVYEVYAGTEAINFLRGFAKNPNAKYRVENINNRYDRKLTEAKRKGLSDIIELYDILTQIK